MANKFSRILSILLCLCLIFEQTGFAQSIGQLNISGYLSLLRNNISQDKFRPLHLRYLSYDSLNNNFKLLLDKGDLKDIKQTEFEADVKTLLDYFFIGLTLPNDSFWVNLRPDSPDNIIDPFLAETDVGRILLEADLQLKKDTAKFTSPQTPEGKEYWDKLYKKAGEIFGYENITIPTLTRPWIVPGEIIVTETKDNAYIYKATLKVMLEEDYLKGSAVYNFKDERLKELNTYASQILREKIIPKLTQEVNTAKRYAALRQVYYSLILSQWFKQRFYGKGGLYSSLIDRRNLAGFTSKVSWSKTTYFKEYQRSFKNGEYHINEPVYTPFGQTVRSYFSGGIKLAVLPTDTTYLPGGLIPQSNKHIAPAEFNGDTGQIRAINEQNVQKPHFGHSGNAVDYQFIKAQEAVRSDNIEEAKQHVKEAIRLLREVNFEELDSSGFPVADTINQAEVAIWVLEQLEARSTTEQDFLELLKHLKLGVNDLKLKQALGYHSSTASSPADSEAERIFDEELRRTPLLDEKQKAMVEHLVASFEDEININYDRDALNIIRNILSKRRYYLRDDDYDQDSIQRQIKDLEELEKSIQAVRENREAKIKVDNLAYQAWILVLGKWIKRDVHIHINPSISDSWILKNGDIKLTPEGLADSIKDKGRSRAIGDLITSFSTFLKAVRFVVQCSFLDNTEELDLRIDPTKKFNGSGMQLEEMLKGILGVIRKEEDAERKRWEKEKRNSGMTIGWLPRVNFVLVLNRADKIKDVEAIINEAIALKRQNNELSSRLIAIDLAGKETNYTKTSKFENAIKEAREAGLFIMAHAGDLNNTDLSPNDQLGYLEDAVDAIGEGGRIGHADRLISLLSDQDKKNILDRMRKNKITIESCPRKDESEGEFDIAKLSKHPFYDLIANPGIKVVLGVDGLFYANRTLSEFAVRLLLAAPQEGFTVEKMKNIVCCFESRAYPMYQGLKEFEQELSQDMDWNPLDKELTEPDRKFKEDLKELITSIKNPPQPKLGIVRGPSECELRKEGGVWFYIFDTQKIKTTSRLTEIFWNIYGSWHSSKWAAVYDLFAEHRPQDKYGAHNNGFYRNIFKGLFKSEEKVLDVGTGDSGFLASIAAEEGAGKVIGIDISPRAIESARQKVRRDNVEFREGDVLSLNFEQESFDWILSRFTLYFLPEPLRNKALNQIFRVLKKGGKIKFIGREDKPLEWSDKEWEQALEDIGFHNINIRKERYYTGIIIFIIDAEKIIDGQSSLRQFPPKSDKPVDAAPIPAEPTRDSSSSVVSEQKNAVPIDTKGGVDFRALPIATQSMDMQKVNLKAMPVTKLNNINLDSEWAQIQNMLIAGIIPSNERIKGYLLSCCQMQVLNKEIGKILGCIADIMRLEEERVLANAPELKELLVLLASEKPVVELECNLRNINISPKELESSQNQINF